MAIKPTYVVPKLPLELDVETPAVLKALTKAHRHLAELKGRAAAMPNQGILIETLTIQEAAASSEIENIVTTQDELFQINPAKGMYPSADAKEVALYSAALRMGFESLVASGGISNNSIISMFQTLKASQGGFRKAPGTTLKNDKTGEIIYVPPQSAADIVGMMNDLENFINRSGDEVDPLVSMAVIHHQFESIHPFPDGNGRIGRILNVLYLVRAGLLNIPILYVSRYITRNKSAYYDLLQETRDTGRWEPWLLYMIDAVSVTSAETTQLVDAIIQLMADYKIQIKSISKRIYSHELVNNLFKHPYTRIEYVVDEVGVNRQTAGKHLDLLAQAGLLVKHRVGLNNYYINTPLVQLLVQKPPD